MATIPFPFFQAIDGNGNPISGAKLFFYRTGTSTLQNTYTTSALSSANSNPVVADANGRFGPIYLGTSFDYKVILADASSVTISTIDPVFASSSSGRTAVADAAYAVAVSDRLIAYTSITASRAVSLMSAATFDAGALLTIVDESGSVSPSIAISVIPNGSDLINGANATRAVISAPYGSATLESDGTSKWTVIRSGVGMTKQTFTSGTAATYTTPKGVRSLRISLQAGGGSGAGASSSSSTMVAGADGNDSTWDVGGSPIVAKAGKGGGAVSITAGGAGGSAGTGTANVTRRVPGWAGGGGFSNTSDNLMMSGFGGGSGGGAGVRVSGAGNAGATNSGGGGAGAFNNGGSNFNSAAGGGSGELVILDVSGPAATYTYTVGATAAGGSSTSSGGAGAAGSIIVEEYYQ